MTSRLALAVCCLIVVPPVVSAAEPVSFAREVVPTFTKVGCNSGACHGTPSGKNGFRLSLRGYDPALDIKTLTKEMGGRRIDRLVPDRSLILQKATASAPHEGGRKLDPHGELYRLVRDWITQGAIDDHDRARPPVALAVTPASKLVEPPTTSQRLRVVATFADKKAVDVTHLTRFTVSDELAARVAADGTVSLLKPGEVVVVAEYMGLMATATFLLRQPDPGFRWPNPPAANYVDTHVFTKLKLLQIEPVPLCSDEEFIRRAYLDAIGRLPTVDETRTFLKDHDPTKRATLIDQLLNRREFADWWALKWADRLGVNQRFVGKIGAVKYGQWVRGMMADNVPEDEFARLILTAAGGNYSNPPAGFYRRLRDPSYRTEEIAQLFMGTRIGCAKCHNHPGERWTQDDYYGMAAFFCRVAYRNGPFFVQIYDKEETVYDPRDGEVKHPRTGAVMRPKFLGDSVPVLADDADRRGAFAEWLTAPGNPFFARASANRIWFHLIGRGIVEPVDDFRITNPPSIPALLDALTADLVAHHFDRKHLIRTIMNSRTYQSAGRAVPGDKDDGRYFSHYLPRRLGAEALLDAVCDVTGVPEKFRGFPLGTRAVQLPDGEFVHPFLTTFGRPPRASACECERDPDTSMHMALLLQGGDFIQKRLADPKGRIAVYAASTLSDREVVEDLFLMALCRRPTEKEWVKVRDYFTKEPNLTRQQQYEDVLHALFNHLEFLFQH